MKIKILKEDVDMSNVLALGDPENKTEDTLQPTTNQAHAGAVLSIKQSRELAKKHKEYLEKEKEDFLKLTRRDSHKNPGESERARKMGLSEKLNLKEDLFDDVEDIDIDVKEEGCCEFHKELKALLDDEDEAVRGYDKAILLFANSELENKEEIIAKLQAIKADELDHINDLQELCKRLPECEVCDYADAIEPEEEINSGDEIEPIEQEAQLEVDNDNMIEEAREEKIYSVYFNDEFLGHYSGKDATEASMKAQEEYSSMYASVNPDYWVDVEDIIPAEEDELNPLEETKLEEAKDKEESVAKRVRREVEEAGKEDLFRENILDVMFPEGFSDAEVDELIEEDPDWIYYMLDMKVEDHDI